MRQEEAMWLRNKANAEIKSGRYDLGLENHRAALQIFEELESPALLLEALHDMGQLHLSLGDPVSAEQYFQKAIEHARAIGMSRGITINLLALGDLQYRHQRLEEAAALYESALQRAKLTGERRFQSQALLSLAMVHRDQKNLDDATPETSTALELAREIAARSTEVEAMLLLAELERLSGRTTVSLEGYVAADTLATELGDPGLMWQIEYGRSRALVQDNQRQAAINALLEAVDYIESVRNRLREKRFRVGYIQDKAQVYIELVRLQLNLGQTTDAFSTAERLREWSFIDQSGQDQATVLTGEQRLTATRMRERVRQLQRLIDEEKNHDAANRRQLALATFSRELLEAEQAYQVFLDDIGVTRSIPAGAPLRQTNIKDHLQANEALIEYVVGPDEIMIFVLTVGGLKATRTPLRQADLHASLELLRDLLQQRDSDRWERPAASLSRSLLEPVWKEDWLENVEHLYLVPHGMLNYLPFALLTTESEPERQLLIEKFTLAYLPTAQVLAKRQGADNGLQNVLTVAPARSRLRHAPEEASSIAALFQPNSRMLTGANATESNFNNIAGDYQVLHLATHGYFNKLNPLLSGLELEADEENDGLLEVHEILDLKLESSLVTLSACETGLGSGFFAEIPAGDDFVGMTRAFLQAGSVSVLATLWAVDDRSTVDLMQTFYQSFENPGLNGNKAMALADAQRTLRSDGRYQHPYYWAPFVLVGAMDQQNHNRG